MPTNSNKKIFKFHILVDIRSMYQIRVITECAKVILNKPFSAGFYCFLWKWLKQGVTVRYENHFFPIKNFLVKFVEKNNLQAFLRFKFPKFPKCSRKFLKKQCHKYEYVFVSVYAIMLVHIGEYHIPVYFLDACKDVSHTWTLLLKNKPSLPLKV